MLLYCYIDIFVSFCIQTKPKDVRLTLMIVGGGFTLATISRYHDMLIINQGHSIGAFQVTPRVVDLSLGSVVLPGGIGG